MYLLSDTIEFVKMQFGSITCKCTQNYVYMNSYKNTSMTKYIHGLDKLFVCVCACECMYVCTLIAYNCFNPFIPTS